MFHIPYLIKLGKVLLISGSFLMIVLTVILTGYCSIFWICLGGLVDIDKPLYKFFLNILNFSVPSFVVYLLISPFHENGIFLENIIFDFLVCVLAGPLILTILHMKLDSVFKNFIASDNYRLWTSNVLIVLIFSSLSMGYVTAKQHLRDKSEYTELTFIRALDKGSLFYAPELKDVIFQPWHEISEISYRKPVTPP